MKNSKVLVVLVGEKTGNLRKFVRWEMEQALYLGMPIIAVNLNGLREQDLERCPPIIRNELAVHISFNAAIMQYALENWYAQHMVYVRQGIASPHYYKSWVYRELGL